MKNITGKIFALVAYLGMVVVNFLANALPINNRSTGEISDAYPNLFAPAGVTFSIWGVIYLLLGLYVVFQFTKNDQKTEELVKKINPFFIASSIANILWIIAWHYDFIGLSVLIMFGLLFSLIKISDILGTKQPTALKKLFISAPFSVYFGWITVATIANITVFLVSVNWNGFGFADFVWAIIVLVTGALIGILRMRKNEDIFYGLVLIWAYLGILLKHTSASGFGGEYPGVIVAVIVCLAVFGFFAIKIFIKSKTVTGKNNHRINTNINSNISNN